VKKILISLEEEIVSPTDGAKFPLKEGLTEKTKEALLSATKKELDESEQQLTEEIKTDLKQRAMRRLAEQEKEFEERLAEETSKIAKVEAEKKQALQKQEASLDAKLEEKNAEHLVLLEQVRELKHAKEEARIAAAQEMDEKMSAERQKIVQQEHEKHALKQAEAEKMLADFKKANEDLKVKLEQSSQQLQGEVLELRIQHELESNFSSDKISEVKKGLRGADVIQEVRSGRGAIAGKILWETKNAKSWSNDWLKKLADDQMEEGADLAVLVTTVFPSNREGTFFQEGAIWVMRPELAISFAYPLREVLLEGVKQQAVQEGKEATAGRLYDFIASRQFAIYMRNFAQSIDKLGHSLQQEQRSMQKSWKQRQREIEMISKNSSAMVGELLALGEGSLKELETMGEYELPDSDDDSDDSKGIPHVLEA